MEKNFLMLDAMGVVYPVGDDVRDLLIPFLRARNPALVEADLQDVYRKASLGEVPSEALFLAAGVGNAAEAEREYLQTCLTLDPSFTSAAYRLRRLYRLAMLSNDIGSWSKTLRRQYSIDELFDFTVISGDVGCRKPDPRFFQIALALSGARASDCVFVDDRAQNLLPAREAGMRVVLFDREGTAQTELERVRSFEELAALLGT